MLESKLCDLALPPPLSERYGDRPAGFEQPRIVELDPHPNRAAQALCSGDAGDGNEGALGTTDTDSRNPEWTLRVGGAPDSPGYTISFLLRRLRTVADGWAPLESQ